MAHPQGRCGLSPQWPQLMHNHRPQSPMSPSAPALRAISGTVTPKGSEPQAFESEISPFGIPPCLNTLWDRTSPRAGHSSPSSLQWAYEVLTLVPASLGERSMRPRGSGQALKPDPTASSSSVPKVLVLRELEILPLGQRPLQQPRTDTAGQGWS